MSKSATYICITPVANGVTDPMSRNRTEVGAALDDADSLRRLLERNPIDAWTAGQRTGGGTGIFQPPGAILLFVPLDKRHNPEAKRYENSALAVRNETSKARPSAPVRDRADIDFDEGMLGYVARQHRRFQLERQAWRRGRLCGYLHHE